MHNASRGFTIVELLVVIVIIAILAAITFVAFNGVQNRAHDSSVQSDLSTLSKKFKLFYAENGIYPDTVAKLDALTFRANGGSYMVNPSVTRNLIYCFTPTFDDYAILAKSKSGNAYIQGSSGSVQSLSTTWGGSTTAGSLCDSVDGAGGAFNTASASGYYTGQTPNWISWTGV